MDSVLLSVTHPKKKSDLGTRFPRFNRNGGFCSEEQLLSPRYKGVSFERCFMVSWLNFTRLFVFLALLAGPASNAGERPRPRAASTRDSASPGSKEVQKPGENHSSSDLPLILERFKVATDGGLLLLPIDLKGKRYSFSLDTGCTETTYDTCFRSLLGEPISTETVRTAGEDITIPSFRSAGLTVGKLVLPPGTKCSCVDLSEIREVSGQEVYGALGMDFLRKHIIRIDFDRGEVTFLTRIGPNAGERIPIFFKGNAPYVRFEIAGLPIQGSILVGNDISGLLRSEKFLVDTGSNSTGSIKDTFFQMLVEQGFLKVQGKSPSFTIAGQKASRIGRVRSTKLADFQHDSLRFDESNMNILGLDYWSRYVVTFDFPDSTMYLKKGSQFNRKSEWTNWSGVEFRFKDRQIVVESVRDNSPAAQAGIKPGDVLLKIGGDKASEITLMRIRRLFYEKGKSYRLLLQRGQKELDLAIDIR